MKPINVFALCVACFLAGMASMILEVWVSYHISVVDGGFVLVDDDVEVYELYVLRPNLADDDPKVTTRYAIFEPDAAGVLRFKHDSAVHRMYFKEGAWVDGEPPSDDDPPEDDIPPPIGT